LVEFKDKTFDDVSPGIGYEPHEFFYLSKSIRINDLGGAARVRDIWKHYVAESYGFIFVLDSADKNRLNESKHVFAKLLENDKVAEKPILM
jgi:ADP-ribosylation factor-like protein 13B